VVVALTTRSLRTTRIQRSPRSICSAEDWPSELSERLGGLCRRSFGHARAPALQEPLLFFPLNAAPVFRRVVSPVITAVRLFPRGRTYAEDVEAPHVTHLGAYPQLGCVCRKRWQRLHCSGLFRIDYDSIDTGKPQS
jgi:hypothetical protein